MNFFKKLLKKNTLPDGYIGKFELMGKYKNEDVFIVGFPKSGNTWMQTIISSMVFGIDGETTPDSVVQHLVPDVHKNKFFCRYLSTAYFKSHDLPKKSIKNVIYIVRDGRDSMVSYLKMLQSLQGKEKWPNHFSLTKLQKKDHRLNWKNHVQAWLNNPHKANILFIKYENLLHQSIKELSKITDFLDLSLTIEQLQQISEKTSFKNRKRLEMQNRNKLNCWPKDEYFHRKGASGDWRNEMDENEKVFFTNEFKDTLRALKYEI